MNKLQKQFEKSCKRSFQFLMEEYSCQIISCGKHAAGMAITYANSTTGVKVNFEPRENLIFVYLIQLRDGKIPAYLDAPLNWVYFDAVLSLKDPKAKIQQKAFGDWLEHEEIDAILARYANALKAYGKDVLDGDFTVFKTIRRQLMSSSVGMPAAKIDAAGSIK